MSTDHQTTQPLAPLDALCLLQVTLESNQIMLKNLTIHPGVQLPMLAAHIASQQIEQYEKLIAAVRRMIAEMEGEDAAPLQAL